MNDKLTDEELIAEIKKRGLYDENGLLKWSVYQLGVDILPIICADIIPVRRDGEIIKIGVIQRATGPEAGKLAVTGGRVKRDQTIIDAISRHLNNDLSISDWKFYSGNNECSPFYVQQYFNETEAKGNYGYDPTKHSVALTYLLQIGQEPKPKNEATEFIWIEESEIPRTTAYNHGEVMRQAFRFIRKTKKSSTSGTLRTGNAE